MVSFPPCKINLGLNVISKRADGYHEIETCFYPVPWTDVLEIIPSDTLEFTGSGIVIPGEEEENLCIKAYQLLKSDFELPLVKIHLHKIIPVGAGLGGGSSNAASTLVLLNKIFNLTITLDRLKTYASHLGSDCSFFIENKPKIGVGRGEVLTDAKINLTGKFIVIIIPGLHISTAEAYARVTPGRNSNSVKSIVENLNFTIWKDELRNDFEGSIFSRYPVIDVIKQELLQQGAVYASMTGSGSAVYGIFEQAVSLKNQFNNVTYWEGILD